MEAKTSLSNAPSKAELTLLGAYDSESNLSTPKASGSGNLGTFSAMPTTNGGASSQRGHHRLMSDASEVDLDGIPRFESEKSASTSGEHLGYLICAHTRIGKLLLCWHSS